jgi:hypothetical protein
MKKCPVCQQFFTSAQLLRQSFSRTPGEFVKTKLMDGKHVIRCPHCKARLRKKLSVWYLVAMVPFIAAALWYSNTGQYAFLIYLSIIPPVLVYAMLPYTPYNNYIL